MSKKEAVPLLETAIDVAPFVEGDVCIVTIRTKLETQQTISVAFIFNTMDVYIKLTYNK